MPTHQLAHPPLEPIQWLDLVQLADFEVSSALDAHPITAALSPANELGWCAATPGRQELRILFHDALAIQRIKLEFREAAVARTQEFTLSYARAEDTLWQEIVRQQWNFSPEGSTEECEEWQVKLHDVRSLRLLLNPDIGNAAAFASLQLLQLA